MRRLTQGTERCGRGALRVTALLTLLSALLVVPATAGAAIGGGLKQLTSTKGCIVDEDPVPSGCEDVRAMQGIGDVVVAPDGKNVYVTSTTRDAVVAFDRNTSTGVLTQKTPGCYTTDTTVATDDGCALIAGTENLNGARGITVSPDNASVYVVTDSARLTGFNRAADGSLSFNMSSFLTSGGALNSVVVSPDGATIYPAGPADGGIVAVYPRNTTAGATLGDFAFRTCFAVSACGQSGTNLGPINDLAVTPDSKQLLLMTTTAMLAWDRVATAGGTQGNIAPSASPTRCVSNSTLGGTCQARTGMNEPRSLAVNDNSKVFLGNAQSLITVNRNAGTNALTADTAGNCFGYPGSGFAGCTNIPGAGGCCSNFYPARALVASPDGAHLYFGTEAPNASILGFTRGSSLSLKPTPLGCTTTNGADGCSTFRQGNRIQAMSVANNSRNVYAVGNNRLFTFAVDRPPVCSNVSAGTVNTAAVTVTFNCSDPDGDALTFEKVTDPARGTLAGISGNHVSYGPQPGTTGVDSFQYRARAAGVASDPATASINVTAPAAPPSGGGGGGGGGGTPPLTVLASTTSINSLGFKKFTKLLNLSVKNLPAGATVRVTCKTKKKKQQKKGCPYKSKRFTTSGARAKLNLRKPFAKKKIPVGTKITITITAPGFLGKQVQYTTRKGKIPKSRVRCLSAAGKLGTCA